MLTFLTANGRFRSRTLWSLLFCVVTTLCVGLTIAQTKHEASPETVRPQPSEGPYGSASVAFEMIHDLQLRRVLRQENPFIHVGERLAYERENRDPRHVHSPSNGVLGRLAMRDNIYHQYDNSSQATRTKILQDLHDTKRDEFIRSNGFGYVRTPIIRGREAIELPDPGSIRPLAHESFGGSSILSSESASDDFEFLMRMHERSILDFAGPAKLGYIRAPSQVAGFVPHHFSMIPTGVSKESLDNTVSNGANDPVGQGRRDMVQWTLRRLNLVSLLRFDRAMVYCSDELPRMDTIEEYSVRDVDAFEAKSLKKLVDDEDIVIMEKTNRIRMVGAIRASKACTRCHSADHGDLIGAFTYELSR